MMKFLNKKRKVLGNKGFSLVELIIVIAIMAVLMAVLAPQLIKYVEKSRVQSDDSFMSELKHAVELACADDAIYSNLPATGNTVTWNPTPIADEETPNITAVIGNAAADAAMEAAIADTIGSMRHDATSKTYQNSTTDYIITITVSATGVVELTENDNFPTAPVA